ncbi:hypothetical protein [Kitasatospora acidiphila]|uniref:hypothetical protein n=1 Tax=Kitasatospora acidiphila TaxID=2567942 RepID=UPI003C70E5D1
MGADRAGWSPEAARRAFATGSRCRRRAWRSGTRKANLLVVPRDWAAEFRLFAERNPRPCPVLEETAPGGWPPVPTCPATRCGPFAITRAPGRMFITDVRDTEP